MGFPSRRCRNHRQRCRFPSRCCAPSRPGRRPARRDRTRGFRSPRPPHRRSAQKNRRWAHHDRRDRSAAAAAARGHSPLSVHPPRACDRASRPAFEGAGAPAARAPRRRRPPRQVPSPLRRRPSPTTAPRSPSRGSPTARRPSPRRTRAPPRAAPPWPSVASTSPRCAFRMEANKRIDEQTKE